MFVNFLKSIINLVLDILFIIDLYGVYIRETANKGFWTYVFLLILVTFIFAVYDSFISYILNRTYKNI